MVSQSRSVPRVTARQIDAHPSMRSDMRASNGTTGTRSSCPSSGSTSRRLRRNREAIRTKLDEVYARVPDMNCKKDCHECCGIHPESSGEYKRILAYLEERGMRPRKARSVFDDCPYLESGRCVIYPVRPLLCRLFGATLDHDLLVCPHGCIPREPLSGPQVDDLIHTVYGPPGGGIDALMGSGVTYDHAEFIGMVIANRILARRSRP